MRICHIVTLLFILMQSNVLFAFDFEKLFMPGEVIAGHKKYENDCKQCHVRLRETSQEQLCMDCHKSIQKDILNIKGFHGKNNRAASSDCKVCHADHKGRGANIVWLDKDRFNHKQTDYPLVGKHKQTECSSCHPKDKKFRDAPSACIDCHKEDDVHKSKLGKKCANCHNPKAWTGKQFDHDKTKFKLRDSHKQVACDLCHVENRYKDTPGKCVSCHAIKDVHQNRFGSKCQDCHSQEKWNKTKFDHDKDTKYRIKGKHRSVTCHACHSISNSKQEKKKSIRSCYSCHRLDDVHKGKRGKKCQQCHSEKTWLESSFDHDKKTKFSLKGAHAKASCQACHQTDSIDKKTDMACYSCHKHEDVHKGQQGKRCNDCHNDASWWMEDVKYDHDFSDFPLIGQHAVAGCESCHLSSAFKDVKTDCFSCHQEDDVHKKALGEDCQNCHNPNDWLIWQFNHDESDFKIKGAHTELHCHSCHFKPRDDNSKKNNHCIDCHNRDDIHDGNFGPNCDNCHTQEDFRSINIRSMN